MSDNTRQGCHKAAGGYSSAGTRRIEARQQPRLETRRHARRSYNNSYNGQYGVSVTQGSKASLDVRMGAGVIDTDISWTLAPGGGATVVYGFRESAASYTVNGSDISTFSQLTATEIAVVEQILQCGPTSAI